MGLLIEEPVVHRREYPEIETNNSEVIVKYSDGRGTSREKRITLVGLAAFVLNCVNQSVAKDQ
jgi:hypothetical protein